VISVPPSGVVLCQGSVKSFPSLSANQDTPRAKSHPPGFRAFRVVHPRPIPFVLNHDGFLRFKSCVTETIQTLKNTVISKSGHTYHPSCDEIKLEVNGNALTEATVGACGLTSGSQIAVRINTILRPFFHSLLQKTRRSPDISFYLLAHIDN
jgi:hypothetical protein